MPKFHIDVCTTFEKVPDRVGRELADRKDAIRLAVRYSQLLVAKVAYDHIDFKCLVIRDEFGRLVASLPFRSKPIDVSVLDRSTRRESGAVATPAANPSAKPPFRTPRLTSSKGRADQKRRISK